MYECLSVSWRQTGPLSSSVTQLLVPQSSDWRYSSYLVQALIKASGASLVIRGLVCVCIKLVYDPNLLGETRWVQRPLKVFYDCLCVSLGSIHILLSEDANFDIFIALFLCIFHIIWLCFLAVPQMTASWRRLPHWHVFLFTFVLLFSARWKLDSNFASFGHSVWVNACEERAN